MDKEKQQQSNKVEQSRSASGELQVPRSRQSQSARRLQRTLGNRLTTRHIRAHLTISKQSDAAEREAAQRSQEQTSDTPLQVSQRPSSGDGSVPSSVRNVLTSAGNPLDEDVRARMEQRFGHDFTDVRVHTDSRAAQSATDVSAHAYTVGENIVF